MFTRNEIIDYALRMGCNRELKTKGMVVTPLGSVFCIATLSGGYENGVYYKNGIKSPKEVFYCGVYGISSPNRLYREHTETKKNFAVTRTDGITKFVYFFEKTRDKSDDYFFHGRYKYISYKFIESNNPDHIDGEILFHLLFVDRPNLK